MQLDLNWRPKPRSLNYQNEQQLAAQDSINQAQAQITESEKQLDDA